MKLTDIKPKKGLKIRRKNWTKDYFWYFEFDEYFNELVLKNCNKNYARICESDLTNDWEIFEEITLGNIRKRYYEFKCELITPNIIEMRRKDLKLLKKSTVSELDWSYKPNNLFGMEIVINNNLTRGEFLLKYVKEETLSEKLIYASHSSNGDSWGDNVVRHFDLKKSIKNLKIDFCSSLNSLFKGEPCNECEECRKINKRMGNKII